jgi:cyclase
MLKKRLVGVITVKNGQAVQSFGYRRYLPLGRPEILAANLDRWGCDEILIQCIDRSKRGLGPDFDLLNKVASMRLSTPLIYGGGIATMEQAASVIQCGADRLCVDAILHQHDRLPLREISSFLGAQALIGVFPISIKNDSLQWLDYQSRKIKELSYEKNSIFNENIFSEVMITDWIHEGHPDAFDMKLLAQISWINLPLIIFGGISDPMQATKILSSPQVSAIAVGNYLNYTELAVQRFKELTLCPTIRPAKYLRFI